MAAIALTAAAAAKPLQGLMYGSRPASRASSIGTTSGSTVAGGQKVRVAVRVRPALAQEGAPECLVCAEDGHRLTLDLDAEGRGGGWPARGGGAARARSFVFDSVHDRHTSQSDLFHGVGMPELLEATLVRQPLSRSLLTLWASPHRLSLASGVYAPAQ